MIGFLRGEVLFSDGYEIIINTVSGVGYQIYFSHLLSEGSYTGVFISHIVKEASEELYGFKSLRDKKMFELLTSVKGVGPKSAFNLMAALSTTQIIDAVMNDDKKSLTKAPGVGAKAASQMILDLTKKIEKIKMYSNRSIQMPNVESEAIANFEQPLLFEEIVEAQETVHEIHDNALMQEAMLACKELGFKEDKIMPIASKILEQNTIQKAEQLVHLVLKEV